MEQLEGLSIEEMRLGDLSSVMEVEVETFQSPWPGGLFEKQLSLGGLISYVVARLGGKIIGYGGAALQGS
ncbi:MAG: ribosomal-protein-alanine N-acetyltransferase RimI, partial [Actinomycetota bacterium]|nr:ribosomal-protein-alanine N-acetyltransferase RimI [Actinomycetota bacterium]